jgi:hypothetical protein
MRHVGTVIGLGLMMGVAAAQGCAASRGNSTSAGGAGGTGGAGSTSTTSTSSSMGGAGPTTTSTGTGGDMSCAKFTAEAKQAPAAMMFALDRSASMSTNGKFQAAQQAIAAVLDAPSFDTMSLGLMAFPSSYVGAPPCLQGLIPKVACGFPGLPQIALDLAGTNKANDPTGVRHAVYQWLVDPKNGPETADPSDASPIYDTLLGGYQALSNYANVDKRVLLLLTDGGFSCTSLSNRPGYSDGLCNDWEYPATVNTLIKKWHDDPSTPTSTFIIGVPGSDSTGGNQGAYATAPYHMKLALSTYAVSGSPETIDPACDSGLAFAQNAPDPAKPCHFDLTGGQFNKTALESAIAAIRGKALGCTYQLPDPPPGQTIDPSLVNVDVTLMGKTTTIPKRSNPNDTCAMDGCWDYDAKQQVILIGKTCGDVSSATDGKVDIRVGCSTVIK